MSDKLGKRARAVVERRFVNQTTLFLYLSEQRQLGVSQRRKREPGTKSEEIAGRQALLVVTATLIDLNAYQAAMVIMDRIDKMPGSTATETENFDNFVQIRKGEIRSIGGKGALMGSYFNASLFLAGLVGPDATH